VRVPFCSAIVLIGSLGCGSSDRPSTPASVPSAAAAPAGIESATFAPSLNIDLKAMTKTPSGLYYRDVVVGTGPVAEPGKRVGVKYAGQLTNGQQFDATGPSDPPFVFHPGGHEVIAGWDEGVPGMRVGGKRQLVIPPALGYGPEGSGPIPPNAILVFTVEVVSVE
jgi:FKBP-type peptidyl-prolyl cis-trans isomerase